ncbi:DUF4058 family protein [Urbifossiella limnaea]|uniref:DUF4058 family protein n=1 Tax=Urbifossiella limnaea TaxID=2528023 RepID=A0A517Y2Y0_9BACT|nr:DUF4058 family protein [Urbifossiella limnaea]QDU24117.1 hypothetical protein ETAA1_61300 [Urbifossiella limnaea]
MPLHDWAALTGWDGVHQVWGVELLYALKPLLPPAYRAYIGTTPTFAIGGPDDGRPDVGVRDWPPGGPTSAPAPDGPEPDEEVAVATLAADTAVLVERAGRLVAAIELVSPRNKDRLSAQGAYAAAYAGYLLRGVHLLLVDVHRRPAGFSFADEVARALALAQPAVAAPFAVGYRVGGPAPGGGRFLAVWRRPLAVGDPLPPMRLPLSADESVVVDLEGTYRRATEAAYLG